MSESYCYLMPQTGYVNLGFWWGAELSDPNDLLEGTGKKLRHVKIKDRTTATSAKVAHMVYMAIAERREGLNQKALEQAAQKKSAKAKPARAKKTNKKTTKETA